MKIAIASGKGGTGKTTVSTNLAMFLAEQIPVILTDLDVEEPNSGLFLAGEIKTQQDMYKMIPEWDKTLCNLCGKCTQVCNFNAILKLGDRIMIFPELCHSCYACSELCPQNALPMQALKMGVLRHSQMGKLDFVESKLDIGQEQAVPLIAQTLDYIEHNFAPEILRLYDSPPGTSCPVIKATQDADLVLLVTEPTPFGLYDLSLAVETMRSLKREIAVIINRYGIGNEDVISYCHSENIPIVAQITNQRRIAELYSRGELIYRHIPEFRAQMQKIMDFLIQQHGLQI